jgi:hypothetical protein
MTAFNSSLSPSWPLERIPMLQQCKLPLASLATSLTPIQIFHCVDHQGESQSLLVEAADMTDVFKRLLDHLTEAAFYSSKDLAGISHQLQVFRQTIERTKDNHDPHLVTLLEARIAVCEARLSELVQFLSPLTPELSPIYEKLVSILRSLSACNVKARAS